MNTHLNIAFDVDGTLIGLQQDAPRYDIIQIFLLFQQLGHTMIVWSGGGMDYARHWCDKLGLEAEVVAKGSISVDISFDDEEVTLGKVNIRV